MFNAHNKNNISQDVKDVFNKIIENIETEGQVLANDLIMVTVSKNEYEFIDTFWLEFQEYVMINTGRFKPISRDQINYSDGSMSYIVFTKSIWAKILSYFSKVSDEIFGNKMEVKTS